nr:hypothetical protein [Anaerolineae bacterium]
MKLYRHFSLMAVVLILIGYLVLTQWVDFDPRIPSSPFPSEGITIYNREVIEGYTLDETALIENARSGLNILKIEQENVYYVRAGYWRISNQDPTYRNTPDHPIMIYSVKGEFGPMFGLASPPGSNPAIPTPTPAPL